MEELNLALLVGAAAVIAAIGAVRIAYRIGLPSLLAYLALGLLLGESVLGIQFSDAHLAQQLGIVGLVVILAEGGLTTSWRHIRQAIPTAIVLATVGVAVSVLCVAIAAHQLLGTDWRLSVLLGAVLAPTDAAAVFSVLRRLPLPPRLTGVLEAESGFNDAPAVIIVLLFSAGATALPGPGVLATTMTYQLVIGAAVGLAIGPLGAYAVRRIALPASGLYPIAVLAFAIAAYSAAAALHGSGFLAVYLAALVLGNARLPHRPATRSFAEGIAWLAQIGLFVMLGLLASPPKLPEQMVPALVIGSVLVLVARPVSVLACALIVRVLVRAEPYRLGGREQAFASWAGLRGAIPIVLATVPMSAGVPGADRLFALVFLIVMGFTAVQGPTLPWVARWLGVGAPAEAVDLNVEAAPLEELKADLLEVHVPPDSRLHGVEIFELRLPRDAAITLIVRDGQSFVPAPETTLRAGDALLVVASAGCRETVERRLRAVHRRGKLAGWFGEHGA